ncbi:MAG: hypothetical protein SFX19_03045 [Alphaproteobacteria bacterium]|nr:hypothetical protein [Alphaproteobacteria bacterium]
MTPEEYYCSQTYGYTFDIGQFTPKEKRLLEKQVKAGRLAKIKADWPFFMGGTVSKTCYIYMQPMTDKSLRQSLCQ